MVNGLLHSAAWPCKSGVGRPFFASNPFFMTLVEKRCGHRSEKYVDFTPVWHSLLRRLLGQTGGLTVHHFCYVFCYF